MSDPTREATLITALRGHFRVLGETLGVDPEDRVRCAYALLSDRVAAARAAGVDAAALDQLRSEGDALAALVPMHDDEASEGAAATGLAAEPPTLEGESSDSGFFTSPVVPEPPELLPSDQRKAPRLNVQEPVLLTVEESGQLFEVVTQDISVGGLFISSDTVLPQGASLRVALKTPEGGLELPGRVVKVVDAAAGKPSGAGIQLTGLTADQQQAMERFLDHLAHRLEGQAAVAGKDAENDALALARRFMGFVDSSRYYDAIGVAPQATAEQVELRVVELVSQFTEGIAASPTLRIADLERAIQVIERVGLLLTTPARRLAYDFSHGYIRAEERLAEVEAGGVTPEQLRAVWHKVFPEHLDNAKSHVERAVAAAKKIDFDRAVEIGHEALVLDPFGVKLRAKVARWEVLSTVARECRSGTLDVEAHRAWAAERGVDNDTLRNLWRILQPKQLERAARQEKKARGAAAAGRLDEARAAGSDALEHDPFNQSLREALTGWGGAI